MPVKAPPPPPPPPSWWSGFIELDGESFLINPQGQALIKTGTATLVTGLNLTLYKDKTGFINNVTVGGLLATDWSSSGFGGYWANGGQNSSNGTLFDVVFALSQSVTFGQYWTLSNTFFNVYSEDVADASGPPGTHCGLTACSGFPALVWDEVKLALNDSFTGWPITFNPYVTFYYELQSIGTPGAGGPGSVSAACFPCETNNYDFFIGMTPTINLEKYWGIPITLKAPTYVTVGPSSFWNGAPGVFGASSGSVGVFTTGLTAIMPLKFMPAQYGNWYVKAGFQWYDVINTALQNANAFSVDLNTSCAAVSSGDCSSILVGFGGIGVAF
jgi:hypothetical protein